MKNVTLRQLRVFAAVSKHANFARAAEELALSAPAVSMQIKDLEDKVGLALFDRTSRLVTLTRVGETLLEHARTVLAAMRDAEDMIENFRNLKGGVLDVAMTSTADYFVPRLLALFRGDHPQVEVRLQVAGNREKIPQLLKQREVELAIMGPPLREWNTEAVAFGRNPQVLVTATDHPFTRRRQVPASALQDEVLITRESGSGTRVAFEAYLKSQHIKPASMMQMASNESIKQAVMAGMGLSLLPLHTIRLELDHGLIAVPRVDGLPVIRHWHVVHRAGKALSPAAEAFQAFLIEEGEKFLTRNFFAGVPGLGERRPSRKTTRGSTA